MLALLFVIPAVPSASADEIVTKVTMDSGNLPDPLYVGEGPYAVKLWAAVSGSTSNINVTSDATWTSTNSAAVKVDRGVLTVLSADDSVTIMAKYKGFTATVDVKAQYRYKEANLRTRGQSGSNAPDQADVTLDGTVSYDLWAVDAVTAGETNITDSAVWESSDTSVATVNKGVVTLKAEGTTTITAQYGGRSDSIVLNADSPYQSITISPDEIHELMVDDTKTLNAEAERKDGGANEDITDTAEWTSSNADVVQVVKGKLTAKKPGIATITIRKYGQTATATVVAMTPFEGVRIVPDKPIVMGLQGGPIQLKLLVMDDESDPKDMSVDASTVWELDKAEIASVKKETDGKAYVYPRMPGTATIKATYKGLTQRVAITVFPTISSISLAKDQLNVYLGDNLKLPAVSGVTLSGDNVDVSALAQWESQDETKLKFENGNWVAKAPGTVTLEAKVLNKADDASPKTAALTVTISKNPLTLVAENDYVSVITGKTTPLPAVTIWYEDGESEDVSDQVIWKSSGTSMVAANGSIKGITPGRATLTGSYSGKTVKVSVQTEEEYTSFKMDPKELTLTVGSSKSIKVTGKTAKGKLVTLGSRIEWTSSDEDLADIRGASIKALGKGTGTLTAKFQGKELKIEFTFIPKLNKLVLSSKSIDATVGGASASLKMEAEYNTGETVNVTSSAVWTTTNAKVAAVTGGVVKPLAKGTAIIKGTFGGKWATARITVK